MEDSIRRVGDAAAGRKGLGVDRGSGVRKLPRQTQRARCDRHDSHRAPESRGDAPSCISEFATGSS